MFASVSLQVGGSRSALLVPRDAVLDEAGKKVLFIVCDECPEDKPGTAGCGAYDKLEVQVGVLRGDSIEIASGLEAGSYVVVAGQYQLKTAMGSGQLEAGCTDH
jgi:multidrug efflux pump subunit AcrA (membrane-fusion protein)